MRVHWPVDLRPAFDALFAIDDALADVVASSSEPALGAIRLAWWREALARLDSAPPPPEPRLAAAALELLPRGVSGQMLSGLEDGWATFLDEDVDVTRVAGRGIQLFSIAAHLLGAEDDKLEEAGELFGLADAVRRGIAPYPNNLRIEPLAGHRFARRLRPLTALSRLAVRDLRQAPEIEPEATPGRAVALLSHKLFGFV